MALVLGTYAVGACIVGLRLGWHAIIRGQYNTSGMWFDLTLATLFWPIIVLNPRVLLYPDAIFGNGDIAQKARSLPFQPTCTALVQYGLGRPGQFTFMAADAELLLREFLHESPNAQVRFDPLLSWLRYRDQLNTTPVQIPSAYPEFQFLAIDLVKARKGRVHCGSCNSTYSSELVHAQQVPLGSWEIDQVVCPHGHVLLAVEIAHVTLRTDIRRSTDSDL